MADLDTHFHGRLRASSGRLLWLGLAMTVLGIAALVFPFASTLVAALLIGWTLLFSGGFTFIGAFSIHGTGPFFGALLLGLVSLAAGGFILFSPLAGAVALTLLLGVVLMLQGAFEIVFAFEMRPHPGWWAMFFSGLASAVLAFIIAIGWPAISVVALGIMLGVNFISTGLGYIFVSRSMKTS